MNQKGNGWIWEKERCGTEKTVLLLFRKKITITKDIKEAKIWITADSRYKFYFNEKLIEVGPSKGNQENWFVDEIQLEGAFVKGENIFAIEVLHYPAKHRQGCHSIYRTETPALYCSGKIVFEDGACMKFDADENWKCIESRGFRICNESEHFSPLCIYEGIYEEDFPDARLFGWKKESYDDSFWEYAVPYQWGQMDRAISPGNTEPRTIPFLYRKQRRFSEVSAIRESVYTKADWMQFLAGEKILQLPANRTEIVELGVGEELTAFLKLEMEAGRNAKIVMIQSEGYVNDHFQRDEEKGNSPDREESNLKGDRTDAANGHLEGYKDIYRVNGLGNGQQREAFEPFWFRTFRYIQLKITTEEEPLKLIGFTCEETGYPLEVKTKIVTANPLLHQIWDLSERTLRRCMHETYEDCPYYEQLQYAMDSRAQILFTYMLSADDRLARKCMEDFQRSQRNDGLLNCAAPSYEPNVIPTYSIFYIFMVYDHMMFFGDKKLVRNHLPTIDRILNFFDANLEEKGYVKKIGGLNQQHKYWSFVDWVPQWWDTTGIPPAILKGPITMESLLYIMGLEHAAKLSEYVKRYDTAKEYRERAEQVRIAIQNTCIGDNNMVMDGPGLEEYSQHTQVFSILAGVVTTEQGKANLLETILHKNRYAQCSVAMMFYLFRALEKTDLYEYINDFWDIWKRMLDDHLTTCKENETGDRSDCHAWGAVILYELPAVILGVRPTKPGFEEIEFHPHTDILDYADGTVITPKGEVQVRWKKENEKCLLEFHVPEGIKIKEV